MAPAIARSIVEARTRRPIETSLQLRKILEKYLIKGRQNKTLAQIYQAIRIEVNNEIEALKRFLTDTKDCLLYTSPSPRDQA